MVAPKKEGFGNEESSRGIDGGSSSSSSKSRGLTERLRDVLGGESDEDLLLDVENGGMMIRWLRALDLHVIGACRADERLKPLLKLNVSSGFAEVRLMSQLNQHFDASEVGMLVRCLCVPLVSIRVGKVNKQGNHLYPTDIRGNLNLSLLPSSNMRISFTGDDGCTERLGVLSNMSESLEDVIEQIPGDSSGRSFLLKLPGSPVLYFWCSEKSKDHGMKLLAKIKDLLRTKPSLSHLTGIREARLDSFATHLQIYLLESSDNGKANQLSLFGHSLTNLHASDSDFHSASKTSRCHLSASHTSKVQPSHQVCLSPRPNTFKDGTARSSSSIRNVIKEKLRRQADSCHSNLLYASQISTHVSTICTEAISHCKDDSMSLLSSINQTELSSQSPAIPVLLSFPPPPIGASKSMLTPYYCWCPPCPSSHLPITFDESLPLPPLSSLLPAASPTSSIALDVPKLPILNLPSLLPKPFVTLPTSQQISTFTPYMSDPIVHIPVIDVCSSGQGYLVSAGPAISSAIPPLLSSFTSHPLIPNTESAVEKSARETLRILIASTPAFTCQKSIVLPEINRMDENISCVPGSGHCSIAAMSQGLYKSDRTDVEAVAMGLFSLRLSSSRSEDDDCVKRGEHDRNNDKDGEKSTFASPNSEAWDSADINFKE